MSTTEAAARHVLGHLDEPDVPFGALLGDLLDRTYLSDGESIMVDLSRQLWNGGGKATVAQALNHLDDNNIGRLVAAIVIVRGISTVRVPDIEQVAS